MVFQRRIPHVTKLTAAMVLMGSRQNQDREILEYLKEVQIAFVDCSFHVTWRLNNIVIVKCFLILDGRRSDSRRSTWAGAADGRRRSVKKTLLHALNRQGELH